jgi:hypothetical protein
MGLLASLFVKIGADTKDLQKGLTATKSGLSDVTKGVLSSVVGFASFTGAILAAGKALKDSINDTVAYAEEVRQLSRTIGSTPEEASKLIQAADDVKVSFSTMQTAMNIAIRNGIEPTIDGMGALADEYVAIQDPIARSKFLLDTFGRSGGDMAALMEVGAEGIRELGDAAESTGLVLSQVDLDATRAYEKAMDELSDTFEGMKIQVGLELIPYVSGEVKAISNLVAGTNILKDSTERLKNSLKSGTISSKEYGVALRELRNAFYNTELGDKDFLPNLEGQKKKIYELTITQDELVDSIFAGSNSWTQFKAKMDKAGIGLGMITEDLYDEEKAAVVATEETENLNAEFDKMKDSTKATNYLKALEIQLGYNAEAMGKLKGAMNNEFFSAQEDFAESQQDIKDKMNGVNGEIATALAQGYSEHGTKVQGLRGDYEELATQYATNATEHEKMKKQIIFDLLDQKMAVAGYTTEEKNYLNELALSWGLVTQEELNFEEAMADWATLITNPMSLTKAELQGILDNINMLPAETVLTIKTLLEGEEAVYNLIQALNGTYTMDIITGFGLPIQPGKAGGGPVYYGNAYPVGERGPELFVPDQSGYIVPNDELQKAATSDNNNQMIRLLQQIASNRAIDESRLARVIRDAMLQVVG